MRTLTEGYNGISLLFDLNRDRVFYLGALAAALMLGAWVGSAP